MPTSKLKNKVIVVMPAFNAAFTIAKTVADIPKEFVDEIILVDDCSSDSTAEVARQLGLTVIVHDQNKGYGGNQKTCYAVALDHDADFVIMIHPDYQYDSRIVPVALKILELGLCDVVLGNRVRTRKECLAGGMPVYKYLANRMLTFVENLTLGQNLGEFHSGFRAYNRKVLTTIPYHQNSDNFVFDTQFLVQAVHFGFVIGDVPVPVRYFKEASSINFMKSVMYGIHSLWIIVELFFHNIRIRKSALFNK
ncbi:MAG: glycosyltransferase family 2 protein [Bacteroidota bacterium]|nr:glycosyltransferase family 2 protein [Bacteroidota bacterium]